MQIIAQVLPNPDSAYPLVFAPYKLDISQFGEKKRMKIEFTITNRSTVDLPLTIIDYQEDFVSVEIPSSVPAGSSVTAKVTVHRNKALVSFEKSLTIGTEDPASKKPIRFTIPIKRTVRKFSSSLNKAMGAPKSASSGSSGK